MAHTGDEPPRAQAVPPEGTDDLVLPAGDHTPPPQLTERQSALRSLGWSALQKWFVRLGGVVTFVVIGRLLEPAEIGLAALALAAVSFLSVVADFGMSTFLVQAHDAGRRTTSTVFWFALTLGCVAALLVAVAAAPFAALLGQPQAEPVLRVLAAGVVLTSLTSVPSALLRREMRFKALAMQGVGSAVVSAAVGISLAVAGAGVWALVVQHLAQNAFTLAWVWAASRWLPALTLSRATLGEIRRFGVPLLGITVLQAVRDRVDQFLVGGIAGVATLGYWTMATRILSLVNEVTMSVMDYVALPLFVRLREDHPRFARGYETAVGFSTAMLAPAVAVLAATSPVVIPALFGPQWQESILPAQLLCIGYAIGAAGYFTKPALLALGRAGVAWAVTGASLVLHVVIAALAVPHGLDVLAAAFSVEILLVVGGSALVLRRSLGLELDAYARAVRSLLAAAAAAAVMFPLMAHDRVDGILGALAVALVGMAVYLAVMLLVNRSLVLEALRDARAMRSR